MELYTSTSLGLSKRLTEAYSTSFSLSSRLFTADIRQYIYAIYGLVRIADEIVDTYRGNDARRLLDELEKETARAVKTGYSTNPIVHSFAVTARTFSMPTELITPFFDSMRRDLQPINFSQQQYEEYIHGSAEVVGLMCLVVFCGGRNETYETLAPGAARLGAAYQKVNFLRDLAEDAGELGRYYFPIGSIKKFDESIKDAVAADITADFTDAKPYIDKLPDNARAAVTASYRYYLALLDELRRTPAAVIKNRRIRISKFHKLRILAVVFVTEKLLK